MPKPAQSNKKRPGGHYLHKNPNCACNPCKARRRREEAESGAAGTTALATKAEGPGEATAPLNADDILVAPARYSARGAILQWIEMRAQGMKSVDIAHKLGIKPASLYSLITRATKEGWLTFDDPVERLEKQLSHKVVDNIEHYLNVKDKQVTLETAKGIGLFKSHQAVKVENDAPTAVLALKIEQPAGHESHAAVVEGNVVGTPRSLIPESSEEN